MQRKVYVLGGAQTDYERNFTKEGKNEIALLREVISDALRDVSIDYDDIKKLNIDNKISCFVGNFIAEKYVEQGHLGGLLTEVDDSFYGVPSARYEAACASGSVAIDAAMTKIRTGDIDVAIVVGWELMKTVDAVVGGDYLGRAAVYKKEAEGVAFPFPSLFGRLADEILLKYKIDEKRFMDALARISDINYSNAKRNPMAQTRKWFMNYEQAANRGSETNSYVGGRLAISDCSQVTDGATVIVLVSDEYLKKTGKRAPIIKGYGHRVAPMMFDKKLQDAEKNHYILPWTRQTIVDAYTRSGLTYQDMDFIETHDCFTSSEYMAISAFGMTDPGREIEAVEDGRISFDGECPINPSGGLIGCGHPVGATGVRMMLDLYKQIAGKAGDYQIGKADNGIMLNIGGTATTNYAFIVGRCEENR